MNAELRDEIELTLRNAASEAEAMARHETNTAKRIAWLQHARNIRRTLVKVEALVGAGMRKT